MIKRFNIEKCDMFFEDTGGNAFYDLLNSIGDGNAVFSLKSLMKSCFVKIDDLSISKKEKNFIKNTSKNDPLFFYNYKDITNSAVFILLNNEGKHVNKFKILAEELNLWEGYRSQKINLLELSLSFCSSKLSEIILNKAPINYSIENERKNNLRKFLMIGNSCDVNGYSLEDAIKVIDKIPSS